MEKEAAEALRKKLDFRWEDIEIILGGKSSIDSNQAFQIASREDADRFVRSYGYDLENPIENAEAFGNFHESVNLIRRYFLHPENPDGLKIEIPRKILEMTDIRDLFLMASFAYPGQSSDTIGVYLRNWACAILKVMHTVSHVDQDIRTGYFADIQQQILDRFYRVIHRDAEGDLFLAERPDDPDRVDLVAFETKPKKSRESTLLKLLHKPENVAEDIFDRVGLRFVTRTRVDVIRTLKFLVDKMIVMPPNIKPSRSRNTLIDLELFRSQLGGLLKRADEAGLDEGELLRLLEEATPTPSEKVNPHSSDTYRSIQFTCRHLIKLRNPLFEDLKELKTYLKTENPDERAVKLIEKVDLKHLQKEIRFFYPYEVQVVDEKSAKDNEMGRSAHSEYKRAQIQTALRRVMGALADASR